MTAPATVTRLEERLTGHERSCGARWGVLAKGLMFVASLLISALVWLNLQVEQLKVDSEVRNLQVVSTQAAVTEIRSDVKKLLERKD